MEVHGAVQNLFYMASQGVPVGYYKSTSLWHAAMFPCHAQSSQIPHGPEQA